LYAAGKIGATEKTRKLQVRTPGQPATELIEMPRWMVGAVQLRPPMQPIGAVLKATDIGEEKAQAYIGKLLDQANFEQLLNETGTLYKPNGEVLAVRFEAAFHKNDAIG
jgi:hypothetical protein